MRQLGWAARALETSRPEELPDPELLARVARSEAAAAEAFVKRFERRVFGLAVTMLGDPRAAEDAAQEAFLRAWRHASTFDPRRGTVLTWLLAITRNVVIDSIRLRRLVPVDPDDTLIGSIAQPGPGPDEAALIRDDVARLRRAVSRLPEAQQRAVVLAGVWGLSAREIAEREGIALGTAKTRIRLALRRLRVALVREPFVGAGAPEDHERVVPLQQESRSDHASSA